MKTFLEEYGLVIIVIIVLAILIGLAVTLSGKAQTNIEAQFDGFTDRATEVVNDAGGTSGETPTPNPGG